MDLDFYNKILQHFLQSHITIKCNNKIIKSGKLTLFTTKQYFIRFYIENEKKHIKMLELPYPFTIEYDKNKICTFNYKLSSLCNNHSPMINKLNRFKPAQANKMYDNIVSIIADN